MDYQQYTNIVIDSIGEKASPRVKHALPILIRKLHEFIVEADVTSKEWLDTCELLIEAGKISNEKRNEMVLLSDILGVESLIDMLDHVRGAESSDKACESAILGPFYREGVPLQNNGTSIVRQDEPKGDYTYLHGRILDTDGNPISNAIVDVWHDAPDGFYDAQVPDMPEYHCRGRLKTDDDGKYGTVCLRPTPYPIPFDHTAGKMLQLLDKNPMRPAHIHFKVEVPGYKTLVTQVFDRKSEYLENDAVFAVKDSLLVDFLPFPKESSSWTPPEELDGKIKYELNYDIKLQKLQRACDI